MFLASQGLVPQLLEECLAMSLGDLVPSSLNGVLLRPHASHNSPLALWGLNCFLILTKIEVIILKFFLFSLYFIKGK